jgi:hypothetical protein
MNLLRLCVVAPLLACSCSKTSSETPGPSSTTSSGAAGGRGGGGSGGESSGGTGGEDVHPSAVVFGADGDVAVVDLDPPFALRAKTSLGAPIANARYQAGRIYVVHPSPADRISALDATTLSTLASIDLPGANPRDIVVGSDGTAYVSQFDAGALAEVDITSFSKTGEIDLGALAGPSGVPNMNTMIACGSRLFVALQRLDQDPSAPYVGVVDTASGTAQSIALEGPNPDYDMHADCAAERLYVGEPVPVLIGGGGIEAVDLAALQSLGFFLTDVEAGGDTTRGRHRQHWHADSPRANVVAAAALDAHANERCGVSGSERRGRSRRRVVATRFDACRRNRRIPRPLLELRSRAVERSRCRHRLAASLRR